MHVERAAARVFGQAYSGWFLRFSDKVMANHSAAHVPVCDKNYSPPKCTPFYHDQEQTPEHPKGDGSCVDPCDCGVHPCGGESSSNSPAASIVT